MRRLMRLLPRARFDGACLVVPPRAPVRFVCPADVELTCVSGTAWITTDGDLRDVVLEAGERHAAARGHRLFINGMPACELRVRPAPAARARIAG